MTDDLIARLQNLSLAVIRSDDEDNEERVASLKAIFAVMREAAEALAAASRPSKKDEDLDSRVAGERLPERAGSTTCSNEPEVGVQFVEDVYAGLAQDRAPGTPSRSGRIQRNPEVEQGSTVHPAPLSSPAAPPPWQPESEEARGDRFHEKWMTLSLKLRALKRYSGDEIACYASSYEWVNAESLDEILDAPLPSPPASAPQPEEK